MKVVAGIVVATALVAGLAGCKASATAEQSATPVPSATTASPTPSPVDPGTEAEDTLLSTVLFDGWNKSFDGAGPTKIDACGKTVTSEVPLAARQREWTAVAGTHGAGEVVWIIDGATDLAAAMNAAEVACPTTYRSADGSTITLVNPGTLTLPNSASDAVVLCDKQNHSGHPTTYGCFTRLGAGRRLLALYGFGSKLTDARDDLLRLLEPAARALNHAS